MHSRIFTAWVYARKILHPAKAGIQDDAYSRAERSRQHPDSLLDVAGGQAALFQVLLVIVLGGVKGYGRNYLGNDRFLKPA